MKNLRLAFLILSLSALVIAATGPSRETENTPLSLSLSHDAKTGQSVELKASDLQRGATHYEGEVSKNPDASGAEIKFGPQAQRNANNLASPNPTFSPQTNNLPSSTPSTTANSQNGINSNPSTPIQGSPSQSSPLTSGIIR